MNCSSSRLPEKMRGAVAVEFALLLIPMLILAFGVAEFGRALYQYNTLTKSVRDSVRHLSQLSPDNADLYAQAQTEAKCLAVYGNLNCTGSVLAPGLTTSMVKITNSINTETSVGTTIALVEVRIENYQFDFFFDPRSFMGGGEQSITFGDIRATMRQS